jgi:tRNA 2-thiouridine synthesizing protein A
VGTLTLCPAYDPSDLILRSRAAAPRRMNGTSGVMVRDGAERLLTMRVLVDRPLTLRPGFAMFARMNTTKLDLSGLKCPLPALKTRKALKSITPGDFLEVHCTDPLSVIDIPNLIRETGDKVEITERAERRIVFLIEKADAPGN